MMKKIMGMGCILLLYAASCKQENNELYGRWNTTFPDGSKVLVVFRKEGSHDWFVNGKLFSSGNSVIRKDTLLTIDPICNAGYQAAYTFVFPAPDSVRFSVVQDTCKPRRRDVDGLVLYREQ